MHARGGGGKPAGLHKDRAQTASLNLITYNTKTVMYVEHSLCPSGRVPSVDPSSLTEAATEPECVVLLLDADSQPITHTFSDGDQIVNPESCKKAGWQKHFCVHLVLECGTDSASLGVFHAQAHPPPPFHLLHTLPRWDKGGQVG